MNHEPNRIVWIFRLFFGKSVGICSSVSPIVSGLLLRCSSSSYLLSSHPPATLVFKNKMDRQIEKEKEVDQLKLLKPFISLFLSLFLCFTLLLAGWGPQRSNRDTWPMFPSTKVQKRQWGKEPRQAFCHGG